MRVDVRQLLQGVIDRVADEFHDRLAALAAPLKQTLEERAITEPTLDRRRLFGILRERIDKDWSLFTEAFDASFREGAARRAGWQRDAGEGAATLAGLELVGDEQVEWDLAIAGAVSRLQTAAGVDLSEFGQRVVGALAGGRPSGDAVNPVDVEVAGEALKKGIESLLEAPAERRALLSFVEPMLSKEVAALYGEVNVYMAGLGYEVPRAKPFAAAARQASGGMAGIPGQPGGGTAAGGEAMADVLSLLQRLVQTPVLGGGGGDMRAPAGGTYPVGMMSGAAWGGAPGAVPGDGGGVGGVAAPMIAVPAAMLESLERLQALDLRQLQAGPEAPAAEAPRGGSVLRELRQQEFARNLPPMEAATIDIVAMLFDFIFDDRLVPDPVKALVGRLQIPLLKVAMQDKTFFSSRDHPARALLDAISRVSIAAGKDLDHGDPVFERIKATINKVLAKFEKDQGIFTTLLADMQTLLGEQESRANDLTEKSKRVAVQQEQGDIAEAKAEEAFARVVGQYDQSAVPEGISAFLARHWTTVLRFAYLRGGSDGHPWSLAIQTLTDLLWSLTPKSGSEERQRLIGMLPELLRRVNAYLDRVGVKGQDKGPFFDALVEIHSNAIKGARRERSGKGAAKGAGTGATAKAEAGGDKPDPGSLTPASAQVSSQELGPSVVVTRVFQEDGIEVESMALSGKVLSSRPIRMADAGNLQRGDWVEFKQPDGSSVRGRLSWISPQRGIMLFTNPQSSKAISISPEALALQMRRGLAIRLVEADEPLIDRALGKAIDSLQTA